MVYIDTSTYNDYDKVIVFLSKNNIPIASCNKIQMVVSAELTSKMLDQMQNECDFEDFVTTGTESLDGPKYKFTRPC